MKEHVNNNKILIFGGIALVALVMLSSGCISPGQALDKAINETANVLDGIKGWFTA